MVRAVPDVPPAAREAARHAVADARVGPVVRALPARRADRRDRRLPRDPTARRAPRSQRLAAAGRISVGPWMVLMDEFMVSGETIVRDLQFGLARGSELGGAMQVGYLPDMFGHVAQMPQLIRLAGMEHAVVWRGVPGRGRADRVLVGGARRIARARRVPLRLVLERPRPPARREGPRAARRRLRAGARPGRASARCC